MCVQMRAIARPLYEASRALADLALPDLDNLQNLFWR